MECLVNNDCPADIINEFEEDGYSEYFDKLKSGTLTPNDIEELRESIITSCECGATLRVEITKKAIDPATLTNENTYQRLGWDEKNAFAAYAPEARFTCRENGYGFALYKFGQYFILISGFTA